MSVPHLYRLTLSAVGEGRLRVLLAATSVAGRVAAESVWLFVGGRRLPSFLVLLTALVLSSAAPAAAQVPFSGWSLGSSVGSPAISWQQIDLRKSLACNINISPTAPGGSGSVAASRLLGQGRWLVTGGLSSTSYSRLLQSGGQVGVTFTPAPGRFGLLQATAGAGFEAGNGIAWENGLWPVASGSARDFTAGLRWAPAALWSVHLDAHGGSLSEQEIGLNTALSPALAFSLGFASEQHEGAGSLASLAARWQPMAQSSLALSLETDIAHEFWSTPLPGDGLASGGSLLGLSRGSGQTATALIDAPLASSLTLHLGASFPLGTARYSALATPAWTASVTRSL